MKVALVHDWLVSHRGGENVLLEIARLFPDAPIYTLVHQRGALSSEIEEREIRTSFIQRLPGAPARFRKYLPLFPWAIESLDLSGFDAIVSTSHCVAKGVRLQSGQTHVAYIHSPMRYIWDQLPHYLPGPVRWHPYLEPLAQGVTAPLRSWDRRTSRRPTALVANSQFVAKRIQRSWGREASVVYPPVDTQYFAQAADVPRSGFLVVSALVPYKKNWLALEWANQYQQKLTIVGNGPELIRLKKAAGPTIEFIEKASRESVRDAYARAEALLFCGIEDFGIVPVEAMAAGCPVVAFSQGGALETVGERNSSVGGVLFDECTVASLHKGVNRLKRLRGEGKMPRERLCAHAKQFDKSAFKTNFERELRGRGVLQEDNPSFPG